MVGRVFGREFDWEMSCLGLCGGGAVDLFFLILFFWREWRERQKRRGIYLVENLIRERPFLDRVVQVLEILFHVFFREIGGIDRGDSEFIWLVIDLRRAHGYLYTVHSR